MVLVDGQHNEPSLLIVAHLRISIPFPTVIDLLVNVLRYPLEVLRVCRKKEKECFMKDSVLDETEEEGIGSFVYE